MTDKRKDNSHLLDFSRWYEFVVRTIDNPDYPEYGHTILSNEEYLEISKFFDYYLSCPNYHYYCPIKDKIYYFSSRYRLATSYENLIEELKRYRSHYEKLFLYTIGKPDSQTYKIRFAFIPND